MKSRVVTYNLQRDGSLAIYLQMIKSQLSHPGALGKLIIKWSQQRGLSITNIVVLGWRRGQGEPQQMCGH